MDIVSSGLKVDGYTWNPVDSVRVRSLMERIDDFIPSSLKF